MMLAADAPPAQVSFASGAHDSRLVPLKDPCRSRAILVVNPPLEAQELPRAWMRRWLRTSAASAVRPVRHARARFVADGIRGQSASSAIQENQN